MYRLIVESLLGLKLEENRLNFAPCLPADWKTYQIHYRYRETVYHITVLQTHAAKGGITVTVDGVDQDDDSIPLVDDRKEHRIEVRILAAPGNIASGDAGLINL
jgi:cellobiose phosphorylase